MNPKAKGFNHTSLPADTVDIVVVAFFHNFKESNINDASKKNIHTYVHCAVAKRKREKDCCPLFSPMNRKKLCEFQIPVYKHTTQNMLME